MWEEVILFKGFWQQRCYVFSACLENSYWWTWTCELCNGLGTTAATCVNNLYLSVGQETWEMKYIIEWQGWSAGHQVQRGPLANRFLTRRKRVHTLGLPGPNKSALFSRGGWLQTASSHAWPSEPSFTEWVPQKKKMSKGKLTLAWHVLGQPKACYKSGIIPNKLYLLRL